MKTLRRIAILVEYDGTEFVGWQVQNNGRSVQGVIESSIKEIFCETRRVVGAGRTDSGVHSIGQVAHFDLKHSIPIDRIADALNSKMPDDVQILDAREVHPDFHARRDAVKRTYSYYLIAGSPKPVIDRNKIAWTPHNLDIAAMQKAAQYWIGKHDLSSFRAKKCQAESPIRSIERFEVSSMKNEILFTRKTEIIKFTIEARSFLHNQVRIMIGSLIEIGRGEKSIEWAEEILKAKNREISGPTAPAKGLVLEKVEYKSNLGLW